ncbi:Mu homology domain-containing protein [Chytriomyces cf. hyalinus JEL632]|nr:Mu homology domain-containing protein [Chytriomyces cf. hyalinus JEL632]
MLSGFFIFNAKGEVLISRLYRNDIKRSISDVFRIQVVSSTDVRSPITTVGSTAFFHHKHENIYLVAVSKLNVNSAIVFEFLYKVAEIGKSYFGKFDEAAVKSNFTLIYELMDEICDFGFPQITEPEALKLYITTEGVKSEKAVLESGSKIAIQATGAVSWRRPDIKYRKNEAFIDVVESVNLLMSSKGTTLRADVSGQVLMRAYLSGMPECKFGLNDRVAVEGGEHLGRIVPPTISSNAKKGGSSTVDLDDAQFHQCVKLSNFEESRTITFIPPDGEFELMRYRSTNNVYLPFRVNAVVDEHADAMHVDYKISVRSLFDSKVFGQNVVIKIPAPPNTNNTKIKVTGGKAKYVGSENAIVWKIARFQGGQEYVISAVAQMATTNSKKAWSRPPISMDFQVVMFTSSGLVVRFLKIFEKSNYQSVKWVRYLTKAGTYQIRF